MSNDCLVATPLAKPGTCPQIIVKCADWVYNSIVDRLSEGSSWTSWRNRHGLGLAVLISKFMYLGGSVLVMMMTTLMFQVTNKYDPMCTCTVVCHALASSYVLFFISYIPIQMLKFCSPYFSEL